MTAETEPLLPKGTQPMPEPKVSDEMQAAYGSAANQCWEQPGHSSILGVKQLARCCKRAGLAAVYPLIEAEVRERAAQAVDRLYAAEAPGCACPAVGHRGCGYRAGVGAAADAVRGVS